MRSPSPFDDVRQRPEWAKSSATIFRDLRDPGNDRKSRWCDRTFHGGRNSGRVVAMISNDAARARPVRA